MKLPSFLPFLARVSLFFLFLSTPFQAGPSSAFSSSPLRLIANNIEDGIIPGDQNGFTDVALYDRILETYHLISMADDMISANGSSFLPSISPDGTTIGFSTVATNLGGSKAVETAQVVVYNRLSSENQLVSVSSSSQPGNGHSAYIAIPVGGKSVFFSSKATNLLPDDSINVGNYRYNLETVPFDFRIKVFPYLRYYLPLISN